ncbi:three prime repair exonuclease 2 [Ochotona curzoniae]|uniref:three prime repair exonuclease 2 n=1 Tax=Ochotona curzoniae TaxID=130825 RepID=UPI001B34F026|nr:three prime repair exonuclease 2 [Ochotona curzoniae]
MSLRGGGKQAGCTGPTASRLLVAQQEAGGGPWPLIKGSLEQPVWRQVPSSSRSQPAPAPASLRCDAVTMSEVLRAETFVFLDLEATGLPSDEPEIVELALFAVHRSSLENPERDERGAPLLPRILDKLTLCISPRRPFTAKASELTGLSSEGLVQARKPSFDSAVVRTLQAFLSRQEGPICLVAHNGFDYDFPLLCMELQRLGAQLPQDTICLDTLPALRGLDRAHSHGTRSQGRKGYSLGALYHRYFQAEPRAAHSAEGDVHTLLMIFLHRAAELLTWADEQARSWVHVKPMYMPPDPQF